MLVCIANREDHDQTASSDLGMHCFSRPFWQEMVVKFFEHLLAYPKSIASINVMRVHTGKFV